MTELLELILYEFPAAAVTKYHKYSGLKQHSCNPYICGSQKYEMSFRGLRSKCCQAWFLLETPENLSLTLPASRGCWHTLAIGHTTPIFASVIMLPSPLSDLLSPEKEPYGYIGPTQIIQDNLPLSTLSQLYHTGKIHFIMSGSRD